MHFLTATMLAFFSLAISSARAQQGNPNHWIYITPGYGPVFYGIDHRGAAPVMFMHFIRTQNTQGYETLLRFASQRPNATVSCGRQYYGMDYCSVNFNTDGHSLRGWGTGTREATGSFGNFSVSTNGTQLRVTLTEYALNAMLANFLDVQVPEDSDVSKGSLKCWEFDVPGHGGSRGCSFTIDSNGEVHEP